MKSTEIIFKVGRTKHSKIVYEQKGWEAVYQQNVINAMSAILNVTDVNGKQVTSIVGLRFREW